MDHIVRPTILALVGVVALCLVSPAVGGLAADATGIAGPPTGWRSEAGASRPSLELVRFLRSPAGLLASAALLVSIAAIWIVGTVGRLRVPRPAPKKRKARRGRSASSARVAEGTLTVRLLVGVLSAACLVMPMVFTIALDDIFAMPKTAVLWIAAGIVGLLLVAAAAQGMRPIRLDVVTIAASSFLLLAVLATAASVDPAHSIVGEKRQFQGLVSTASYVVLFFGARFAIADVRTVRILAAAILTGGVVAAGYAVAQWLGADPIWDELFKGRVFSTVGQANALATTLGTAMTMSVALFRGDRRRVLVLGAVLVLLAVALAVTFSRGGYLAFVVAAIAVGLILLAGLDRDHVRRLAPMAATASGVVLVAAVVVAIAVPPVAELVGRVGARFSSIVDPTETSSQAHVDLWAVATRVAVDHPLLGTGPDTFVLVFPDYRDAVLSPDRAALLARFRPESPHDVYLAIASGSGIPSLIALAIVLGSALVMVARAARRQIAVDQRLALAALSGSVVVFLVASLFLTADSATSGAFWVILGALVGSCGRVLESAEVGSAG